MSQSDDPKPGPAPLFRLDHGKAGFQFAERMGLNMMSMMGGFPRMGQGAPGQRMAGVAGAAQPAMQAMQPPMGAMPAMGAMQPAMGAMQPAMGAMQPAMGAMQPPMGAMGAMQPAMGAIQPALGAMQPARGNMQPPMPAPQVPLQVSPFAHGDLDLGPIGRVMAATASSPVPVNRALVGRTFYFQLPNADATLAGQPAANGGGVNPPALAPPAPDQKPKKPG